ncbi:heavy metal translocating P-type ATPase [Priestia taiwanensis]|uniref:Cd(2+)-exporting ATPase n=1 Tax=Priestia taiwanensis TaxID=1347902 RepID=A0A917AL67_9BACI|nr:heavy metal translocating P-type ATPase [Priestia taiwanensis]MBM7362180.1 Cd2+/Zn2+-exporting ATPase [Priestia taiwanensis]GGE60015.1 cadmium transporter [Priestia taiwanensis]
MGERKIKREYTLDGLDCASCASKIEDNVRKLTGVSACNVNFVNKTMIIESDGTNGQIAEEAKDIVRKLEPDVVVIEKERKKQSKQVLILNGVDCADCAAKIEHHVREIPNVTNANFNFVTKKLAIETEQVSTLQRTVEEAKKVINKLEPHVEIRVEEKQRKQSESTKQKSHAVLITRLVISAALTAIAALTDMSTPIEVSLFVIAYVLAGGDIVWKALRNIARGQVFDENFLMSIATLGAFAIGEYPEGVAVMMFYQVGELFQSLAVNRSRKSISALMDIRPDYANLQVGNETKKVDPEDVQVGDIIIIKPGEKVPLDGKVISGSSMVDTSALTGESVPREVKHGDDILGGFINKNGVLTVEVTKEFGESTVSKILDLVQNASSRKAPTENFITKFARYYTPAVVLTALAIAVIPPLVMVDATFGEWVYRALVFLVISCPCALVVSIPLGFFGGIGGASKSGILVKGSNYLEALNDVEYVVFDKTGTLTKGVFDVTEVNTNGSFTKEEVIEYAAFAEVYSNHPIAESILRAYNKDVNKDSIADYEEIAGHGIKVRVDGKEVLAGNAKLMNKENILYQEVNTVGTFVFVAVDKQFAGSIVISDEVKEDAKQAIQALKEVSVKKTVMLTGDAKKVGEAVGQKLGVDEVYAELLPHQKVEELERIDATKSSKGKVIFVGDGINDTPVLARADIGMAMGGLGSDAAIETADIVIMTDEPSKIPTAIKIAKRTRKIVWQNIIFSLGVKGIVLLLGAFGIATMWEAVFADVGVTLLAIMNAMRALKVDNL